MAGPEWTQGSDLLDVVHDSVIVRDLDGIIRQWNAAAEAQYGWRRDEVIGRRFGDLIPCQGGAAALAEQETQVHSDGKWEGVLRRTSRGGGEIWVDIRWSLRRDGEGQPLAIVETGRDITAKRRAEQSLELNEYRFRNLFQAMAVAFWEIDFGGVTEMLLAEKAKGVTDFRAFMTGNPAFVRRAMERARILDVNAKTVELFGARDPADMVGDGVSRYWPDASLPVFVEAVMASVEAKANFVTETQLVDLSGGAIDVLFTVSWSPESRKRGIILLGIVDMSERVKAVAALAQSERKYRSLFHHIPISLWQLSARGIVPVLAELRAQGVSDLAAYFEAHPDFLDQAMELITVEEVNDHTIRLFGGRDQDEFVGPITHYWKASPETLRRSLIARFRGAESHTEETRVCTLDGRTIDILFSSAFPPALADLGITIVGVVDIAARTAAEEALRRVQADFAHAARVSMLGELTASIAHEVNQPLAAIATNGEAGLRWLARPEPDLGEVNALAARIVADARRAADIISRIRAMASRREPEQAMIALDDIIGEALLFLRHDLQHHQVVTEVRLAPDLPRVRGDRTQIQQVLVNLAMNAVQAMTDMPEGQRRLVVRTELGGDGMISTIVEDSGPGLGDEQAHRLFESFFSTKASGMGMGLPICRSIIEAHGGRIEGINRSDARGARFTFTLPAIAPDTLIETVHTKV